MSILRRFSVNFLSLTISYLSTLLLSLFTSTYLLSSYLSVSLYFEKSLSVGMECVLASSFIYYSKCTSIYSSIIYFLFSFNTFSISSILSQFLPFFLNFFHSFSIFSILLKFWQSGWCSSAWRGGQESYFRTIFQERKNYYYYF